MAKASGTARRVISDLRLVNGSTGDPVLYVDYPGMNDALLFDAGDLCRLPMDRLRDLEAVFITHHHVDHFIGLDRIVRANMDSEKTLHIFGPINTIRKVYDRIVSYDYQYFPFQKITLKVTEVVGNLLRSADLECTRRFPPPVITESAWAGPTLYCNDFLAVEAAATDHTVPGLAFALVEQAGYHPDPDRLGSGLLKPGPWVQEVQARLRRGAPLQETIAIQGGQFTLAQLAADYFAKTAANRVTYITDTYLSAQVAGPLARLAHRARKLYCDCYYADSEEKSAQKHRHMTVSKAATLARDAKVEELILIHFASRYAGRYQELVDAARAIFPNTTAEFS